MNKIEQIIKQILSNPKFSDLRGRVDNGECGHEAKLNYETLTQLLRLYVNS